MFLFRQNKTDISLFDLTLSRVQSVMYSSSLDIIGTLKVKWLGGAYF